MTATGPPHDDAAEQATLGSALIDAEAAALVVGQLQAGDFYPEHHQRIFGAIRRAHRGGVVDLITVTAALRESGDLEAIGGPEYLMALINTVPTAAHVQRYLTIVRDTATRRRGIEECSALGAAFHRGEMTPETAALRLLRVGEGRQTGGAEPVQSTCAWWIEWMYAQQSADYTVEGPRLGIAAVDTEYGGFAEEGLVVVKAPEKFGKTTLLRQSALATARWCLEQGNGQAVVVYLLEDAIPRWLNGAVAYLSQQPTEYISRGGARHMAQVGWGRESERAIAAAVGELPKLPLLLSDTLRAMDAIAADVERLLARGVRLCGVYIDHASQIDAPGEGHERGINVAMGLLTLWRRTGIPVLTGSQISLQQGGHRRTRFMPELEHHATSVFELQRGPEAETNQDRARQSTEGRLVTTHRRHGDSVPPVEVYMDMRRATIRPAGEARIDEERRDARWE